MLVIRHFSNFCLLYIGLCSEGRLWPTLADSGRLRHRAIPNDSGRLRHRAIPDDSGRIQITPTSDYSGRPDFGRLLRRVTPDDSEGLWTTPDNAGKIFIPESVPKFLESDRSTFPIFINFALSFLLVENPTFYIIRHYFQLVAKGK